MVSAIFHLGVNLVLKWHKEYREEIQEFREKTSSRLDAVFGSKLQWN